jgi:V8-like Glu-specific endopeptidase
MRTLTSGLVTLLLSSVLAAQTAPLKSELRPWVMDSGSLANPTARPAVVFERIVHVAGAPWLRLMFDQTSLPAGSYVEVISVKDGHSHVLDRDEVARWRDFSAYLNGDLLLVRLTAGPGAAGVRISTKVVDAGVAEPPITPMSQCGPTDDRIPSTDPRSARVVPIGCTAWLISPVNCFLSAGHCCTSSFQTIQFNVPPSNSNGSIQHPGPQDQYVVSTPTVVRVSGGVGNDWCTAKSLRNATSGRHAGEVQGAFFQLGLVTTPPRTIRITGFGTDTDQRVRSQTQQTHAGPQVANTTSMRYQTDTTGGNSGSPVIDETTGHAIGIHTHGGCSTSGSGANAGTRIDVPALAAAITAMKCGDDVSAGYGTFGAGCNGTAGVPLLANAGLPLVGASFVVNLSGARASSSGLLLTGTSNTLWSGIPLPFNLGGVGAPQCNLLVAAHFLEVVATNAVGAAAVTVAIPNDASLLSGKFYQQFTVLDSGANALGYAFTRAGEGTIGNL